MRGILILDEIFAVGDAEFKAAGRRRLGETKAAGTSFLLVSHGPADIADSCDRGLLLEDGLVVCEGRGDAIARAYERLLGAS